MKRSVWKLLGLGLAIMAMVNLACKKAASQGNVEPRISVSEEHNFELPDGEQNSSLAALVPNDRLLLRDSSLLDYYRIDAGGIRFFREPGDSSREAEFIIYPDEYEITARMFRYLALDSMVSLCLEKGRKPWPESYHGFKAPDEFEFNEKSFPPLKGLRVALDPGHMAATPEVAQIEGKYVKMKAQPKQGRPAIEFNEANLTLATAHLVRQQLEAMGATVLMTRTQPGIGVTGLTWEGWRSSGAFADSLRRLRKEGELTRRQYRWWKNRAPEKDIMKRFFTPMDLRARAKMINAFQPHLTLIIHYNIDSHNWEKRDQEGYFPPAKTNYLMAFAPGSFMKNELATTEDRVAYLRLLVSRDVESSVRLCQAFVKHSEARTGVRIVDENDALGYLEKACLLTDHDGVYTRNLTLTRLIAGPVCYGESLCQDNEKESLALNQQDIEIAGLAASSRLKTVADAYVETVLEFVKD
jgi:N-acetylmuramoyl-L-alanine amidase